MKTIRVIDLLTKIANGEEVPRTIIFRDIKYTYTNGGYVSKYGISLGGEMGYADEYEVLNETIEIIEEDKPIEELKEDRNKIYAKYMNARTCIDKQQKALEKKDKVIDEMAKELDNTYRNRVCEKLITPEKEESDCYLDVYIDNCKACIKQYFYRKVEEKWKEELR